MFSLYLDMRDTVYSSQKTFFEVALIYGLMLGSITLFAAWEIVDAILKGGLTRCIVKSCCFCCCIPEASLDTENEFLE